MDRERKLRIVSGLLALAGLGVAIYIAIAEAGGGSAACLAGGEGCHTVAASSYSELGGVNVAVIGIGGYVMLVLAALVPGDPGRLTGFLFSLIGVSFSAYLTYLELFVIDAICQWCVASAVLMCALFVVNTIRLIRFAGTEPPARTGGEGAS